MTANYGTTAGRAPGSLHSGTSMCIPSVFEGMTSHQMTLAMLKMHGNEEWFSQETRGRRKGEERVWVVTRYDIQAGTHIACNVPFHLRFKVDMEDIKAQLRKEAARTKI